MNNTIPSLPLNNSTAIPGALRQGGIDVPRIPGATKEAK